IVQEYVPLGDQAGLEERDALQRTRAGEFSRWRCDYRIATRDGETRWIADASIEVMDEHGRPKGSIGMLQDITERKRAEERLGRSEELYRRAISQAGGVPYVLDYATSSYTFMGEEIEQLTGYTPAEFTPDFWEEMVEEAILTGEQAGLSDEEAVRRTRS